MGPKKDPNKPKGRMSAYAYYVQARRAEYKSRGEDVDFTAFSKECSLLWKEVGEEGNEGKEKYTKLSEKDKIRYDREMKNYVPPDGVKKKKTKKDRDPNQPKRAMSAFFCFADEKRPKLKEKHPSATVGDLAKKLGAAWRLMTEEQKNPFETRASKDRARYAKEMAEFKKGIITGKSTAQVEDEEGEDVYSDED